jgi:hypothetical protein
MSEAAGAIFESADYNESNEVDDESRRISRKIYALNVVTDNRSLVSTVEEFFEFADRVESYLVAGEK